MGMRGQSEKRRLDWHKPKKIVMRWSSKQQLKLARVKVPMEPHTVTHQAIAIVQLISGVGAKTLIIATVSSIRNKHLIPRTSVKEGGHLTSGVKAHLVATCP